MIIKKTTTLIINSITHKVYKQKMKPTILKTEAMKK